MSRKTLIYIGASVGGIIGGYIPALWGDNLLGGWSILLGTLGGLAGIWAAYKVTS